MGSSNKKRSNNNNMEHRTGLKQTNNNNTSKTADKIKGKYKHYGMSVGKKQMSEVPRYISSHLIFRFFYSSTAPC